MEKSVRKLTVTGNGKTYYVTLPRKIVKALKWKKGEKKVAHLEEGRIIIEDWKNKPSNLPEENSQPDKEEYPNG